MALFASLFDLGHGRQESNMVRVTGRQVAGAVVCVLMSVETASAQLPWVEYVDSLSGSRCGVVNASNMELVVLDPSGELARVDGTDVAFVDTYVDGDDNVYYNGFLVGYIEFATDGDGYETLWLFTTLDDVADVDPVTGDLAITNLFPTDFVNVPCDACAYWDAPDECNDADGDGVVDAFDDCPLTPFDEVADSGGCSCSQLDDDLDGVDNCADICPLTPSTVTTVDIFGCTVGGGGGPVVSVCGTVSLAIFGVMFIGLAGMRPRLRRRFSDAR